MKIKLWLLSIMSFSVFCSAAYCQEIKIYTEEFPPFNFTQNGKVTGLCTEIITAMINESDYKNLGIESLPWARAYHLARTHPNIGLFST